MVLDFRLDLLGEVGESLVELVDRGALGDADVLELLQLRVQVLQVQLRQLYHVLRHRRLGKYVQIIFLNARRK